MAPELLLDLPDPKCKLPPAESYRPYELAAEKRCYVIAEEVARSRHGLLASAVRVREAAASQLVKGSR